MNLTELSRVIEQVGKDRGIKREIIVGAIEAAVLTAAQKKFGEEAILEAHYNPDEGEIELFQFKNVVESDDEVYDPELEIGLQEAQKLDPDVTVGDELGIKVPNPGFGRIDAQAAKQIIFQKVRDAERDIIFNEFIHRKGEVISGIARRVERGNLVIDLGRTDAILPRGEVIPGETFKPGDRVQAYLEDVAVSTRGPQLYLTRTAPEFLMKLFEHEVPEIGEGIVEIRACAREPGHRAKIAVTSRDPDVDPVGACVGMKGVRVQNVISELRGEKIDIIPWNENATQFVRAALQPAEVQSIRVNEKDKTMEVMVDDSQLSLAIGRKGQNVRLAANLTGWHLDIMSKSKLEKRRVDSIWNLQQIEGLSDTMAQSILNSGFHNLFQLAAASMDDIKQIPGFETNESAASLKERAVAASKRRDAEVLLNHDGTAVLEGLPPHIAEAATALLSEKTAAKKAETQPAEASVAEEAKE